MATFPYLFGQIICSLAPESLSKKLTGSGVTVTEDHSGSLLAVVRGVGILILRSEEGIYSATAQGAAPDLESAANRLSLALKALWLTHRIEVFDEDGGAFAFFHLDWPYPGEMYEEGKPRIDLSFEEWVAFVFDRPVTDSEWYWDTSADWWEGPPVIQAEYLALLFESSPDTLERFSDAQLNRGLYYVASNGQSDYMFALVDETVDWPLRRRALRALYDLYAGCFASRCSPGLSHRDEQVLSPLNAICYMWFDVIPIHAQSEDRTRHEIDEVMLEVMERILTLDSEACQEGALHGLGHWQYQYPKRVQAIIDAYLARNRQIRKALRQYALNARSGCIQ